VKTVTPALRRNRRGRYTVTPRSENSAGPEAVPGAVRPERGLAPSGHCVLQLQDQRLRERFGSRPSRLILLGIFPQAQLKDDVPLVRLEDDLRLATFAHGPPDTATEIAKAAQTAKSARRRCTVTRARSPSPVPVAP